ncbi:MAG: Lrp/AsnC family transcriptional regulator [Pseudomonadales bacterium]|jgi:Lrp/AsnC family transcriptional regulator|nr:Lrp/AsnC family transcriptional regulator [Pseudomonadales bacterium]
MSEVDSFDRQILELLQIDAGLSLNEIADRVALSRTACWRRIQRLEEAGIIRGRVALLDPAALGLDLTVYVLIKTNRHNREWAEQFTAVLGAIPEVLEAYRLSGDVDYLLKAVVADMRGYDRLYRKLIAADLFDVSSSFVMETLKQTTALPLTLP